MVQEERPVRDEDSKTLFYESILVAQGTTAASSFHFEETCASTVLGLRPFSLFLHTEIASSNWQ